MDLTKFFLLADLFNKNGYHLYLVGGSVRDYLLKRVFTDFDLATDATPNDMKEFLKDADYTYARFGNVHYQHMDITTLRIEGDYQDYRHPNVVKFTKKLEEDYLRRDFTINALYLDGNLKLYDFCHGKDDLKHKIIRLIGDPNRRIKEDPLRILRAERFKKTLGFTIESKTLKAMKDNKKLIEKLNTNKIKEEIKKHILSRKCVNIFTPMSCNFVLAINFEYTLMEFYKSLSLTENDVAVIFMIKHLLEQKNPLITADLLAIKMSLSVSEIDTIIVNLMKRGYLAYKQTNKGLVTSLEPLEEKLSKMYQIEIAKDESKRFDEASLKAIKNIYEVFERELGRTLSPVELSLIDEWVNNGISESDVINALHEAIHKKKTSLKAVDKILMKWQTRKDIEEEGHSAITETWKKGIDKTIDIAQKKWSDK